MTSNGVTDETTILDADLGVAISVDEAPAEPLEVSAIEPRIYEIGYHIIPTVKEEDVEKIVGGIRSVIEKSGGSFIAEGAPSLIRLAYPISALAVEGEKRVEYDRGYFGWIKFESAISAAPFLIEKFKT